MLRARKSADTYPHEMTALKVLRRTGLTPALFDALVKNGGFPSPLPSGNWWSEDVESWASINLVRRQLDAS